MPKRFVPPRGVASLFKFGRTGVPSFVLHETKQGVAERRRDIEPGDDAALHRAPLDAGHRRRSALAQQRERALRVLDVEDDSADALRMPLQPLEALALRPERLDQHETHVRGLDDAGARVMLELELGRRHGDLGEVELLAVVIATALEISHEHVHRRDPMNPEGLFSQAHDRSSSRVFRRRGARKACHDRAHHACTNAREAVWHFGSVHRVQHRCFEV